MVWLVCLIFWRVCWGLVKLDLDLNSLWGWGWFVCCIFCGRGMFFSRCVEGEHMKC